MLLLVIISLPAISQTFPKGLPSPSSNGYSKIGYSQFDSGMIQIQRDTFNAKYPTVIRYIDGNLWQTLGAGARWFPLKGASISAIYAGYGLTKINDSTISTDTSLIATRLRVQKAIDSLGVVKQPYSANTTILGNTTTGSGSSIVLSGSPTLTLPNISAINVSGGIAALPTGSGTLAYRSTLGINGYIPKWTSSSAIDTSQILQLGGLISIGGASDGSSKFTLNGKSKFTSNIGVGNSPLVNNSFVVDLPIQGASISGGIIHGGEVQSGVADAYGFSNTLKVAASASVNSYSHFGAINAILGSGAVLANQYGFITDVFTVATNNYGFFGQVTETPKSWNLFMVSSAKNYVNGKFFIGDTVAHNGSPKLDVTGKAYITDTLQGGTIKRIGGTSSQYLMADGSVTTATTLTSAQYTPTLGSTASVNVSASSVNYANYMRMGDIIIVYFSINVTPTASATNTEISIDLPIGSTTGGFGSASAGNSSQLNGIVKIGSGSSTDLKFTSTGTTSVMFNGSFSYYLTPL